MQVESQKTKKRENGPKIMAEGFINITKDTILHIQDVWKVPSRIHTIKKHRNTYSKFLKSEVKS